MAGDSGELAVAYILHHLCLMRYRRILRIIVVDKPDAMVDFPSTGAHSQSDPHLCHNIYRFDGYPFRHLRMESLSDQRR